MGELGFCCSKKKITVPLRKNEVFFYLHFWTYPRQLYIYCRLSLTDLLEHFKVNRPLICIWIVALKRSVFRDCHTWNAILCTKEYFDLCQIMDTIENRPLWQANLCYPHTHGIGITILWLLASTADWVQLRSRMKLPQSHLISAPL